MFSFESPDISGGLHPNIPNEISCEILYKRLPLKCNSTNSWHQTFCPPRASISPHPLPPQSSHPAQGFSLFYSCCCWLWVRLWVSVKCLHCNRLHRTAFMVLYVSCLHMQIVHPRPCVSLQWRRPGAVWASPLTRPWGSPAVSRL